MSQIYFLSDFHLDVCRTRESQIREQKVIKFLEAIEGSATDIFLLGDIFDFWFEYKHVVPKGYVRLLGTLAKIVERGVKVHYFAGNHDMWLRDYFSKDIGMNIYLKAQEFVFDGKVFYIGHGDGLGPKQWVYKFLKHGFFKNRVLYYPFINLFHPDWLMPLGRAWSEHSRQSQHPKEKVFLGEGKEFLIDFCKSYLKNRAVDYFVFGHRHLPLNLPLSGGAVYLNTGDMIHFNSYVYFDGKNIYLKNI